MSYFIVNVNKDLGLDNEYLEDFCVWDILHSELCVYSSHFVVSELVTELTDPGSKLRHQLAPRPPTARAA